MSEHDDFGAFLIGFIVGGVAGAVAALLLAPQSGEETRTMIRDRGIELRDQAAKQADVIVKKASEQANVVAKKATDLTTEAKSRGKILVDSAKKVVAKKPPEEAAEE